MKFLKAVFLISLFSFSFTSAFAQENELRGKLSGYAQNRYMSTYNNGSAEDYYIMVSAAKLKYEIDFNDRFTFGLSGMALMNWGKAGIERRDALTGAGPIYESNLWSQKNMDGSVEFSLPEFYLNYTIGYHFARIGRILEDSPIMNTEVWPLPTAFKGLWYEYRRPTRFHAQVGFINRISSRFVGKFQKPGESIGAGGIGVGLDGAPSKYFGNTKSAFVSVTNLGYNFGEDVKLDLWNYYTQNISNTIVFEPKYFFGENREWTLAAQVIYQNRVGDGGNPEPELRYFTDASANSVSIGLDKKLVDHTIHLGFTRIPDQGRLLMPREWGREYFYTFTRRTRVEGFRDVTSAQVKWSAKKEGEKRTFSMFSSLTHHWLPNPDLKYKSKYQVPSTLHWDASLKITPKKAEKGLAAELYMAYRFLTDEESDEPVYLINKANFLHTDFILTYRF